MNMIPGQSTEQRRFPRYEVSDELMAFDYRGPELGRIEKIGGGGMQVRLSTQLAGCTLVPGSQLLVDVFESGQIRHTIRVAVRFRDAHVLGLEFVN
jgi:PilZ domain